MFTITIIYKVDYQELYAGLTPGSLSATARQKIASKFNAVVPSKLSDCIGGKSNAVFFLELDSIDSLGLYFHVGTEAKFDLFLDRYTNDFCYQI